MSVEQLMLETKNSRLQKKGVLLTRAERVGEGCFEESQRFLFLWSPMFQQQLVFFVTAL